MVLLISKAIFDEIFSDMFRPAELSFQAKLFSGVFSSFIVDFFSNLIDVFICLS